MAVETESVLIVGSGGREDALARAMYSSPTVGDVYIAPGNGGTSRWGTNVDIASDDIAGLAAFAADHDVGLTVVGPETPLAAGVVDAFTEDNMAIFGPTQAAARLETDKAFAASFVERHRIPHPFSLTFTDRDEALAYVHYTPAERIVIKASGLAAGKGVVLPERVEQSKKTIDAMMRDHVFGDAGREVVIQERLRGPEVSMLALSDDSVVVPLLPAQDHKRIGDHDTGPNTGGMGAYAPVPWMTPEMIREVQETILVPTIRGMQEDGVPFKGVLYAGIMWTDEGPKVLEYNVRFGDPEAQPILLQLKSDLAQALRNSVNGTLANTDIEFTDGYAACVVLAAAGYPGAYSRGQEIYVRDEQDPNIEIFHAGTRRKNGRLITNGGRVLGVTGRGETLDEAVARTYEFIHGHGAHFESMQYRRDIGRHLAEEEVR